MTLRVLCISDYFLPGYKGGGPIRTLDNMRELLAGEVELAILTRDRDLGSDIAYPGITPDCWTDTPNGRVYYASPTKFGPASLQAALKGATFDLVYINSFFSYHASISLIRVLGGMPDAPPVLLAPRGEFSPGAMALKSIKKRTFLWFARGSRLYNNISWQASAPPEVIDILRVFPKAAGRVYLASDPVVAGPEPTGLPPMFSPGELRLAFISRISPKKNLDGLLRTLVGYSAPVNLDIYGPVEDAAYWRICQDLISALPEQIRVFHHGALPPEDVSDTFSRYDLFAFPTHGENFGHVIFEALRAGTPVLLSENTPWQSTSCGAITVVKLEDQKGWHNAIAAAAARSAPARAILRQAARNFAIDYVVASGAKRHNLDMFRAVIRQP